MADPVLDVSPDMAFGLQTGGQNTGGRMVTVAADPRDRLRLYAASHLAGVWTTGDGGRSWRQASRGLGTGSSCAAPPVLAVDPGNPRRLLYTTFEDFRPGNPFAGLYVSIDAAATWRRVPLPVVLDKGHGTVGFAVGPEGQDHPWVLTSRGLLVADTKRPVFDSPDQWHLVPSPILTIGAPGLDPAHVVSDGEAVIVCSGATVFRTRVSLLLAARGTTSSPWVGSAGLPSDFVARALSTAPAPAGGRRPVLVLGTVGSGSGQALEVWRVDPGVSAAVRVGRLAAAGGSGVFVVAAPPRARLNGSYDVIVGDRLTFHHGLVIDPARIPQVDGGFDQVADVHRDPWSVAFPADYPTATKPPAIYLAHDGGVSVRQKEDWVTAMSGLHGYKSANLAAVTVGGVDALYLPSGDNDLWASRDGGARWESMGGRLGDAGAAFLDPQVPGQVAAARNGIVAVYRSSAPASSPPGGSDPSYYAMFGGESGGLTGLSPEGGTEPPQIPGFAQILTLPGGVDKPVSVGDYLTLRNDADPAGAAQILRSSRIRQLRGGEIERIWQAVTTDATEPAFAAGSILALAASGGHRRPIVYVLHTTGTGTELLRSQLDSISGTFRQFTRCSGDRRRGQPTNPQTLHVNPWNADIVYVWDDSGATATIRSSADGGTSWREEPALRARATNQGEFRFGFQRGRGDVRCGPLQSLVFLPTDDQLRVAVTFPGGLAFTRNGGLDWFALGDDLEGRGPLTGVRSVRELIGVPYSAYLTPRAGAFRLYVALLGRGLIRIDTTLATVKPLP